MGRSVPQASQEAVDPRFATHLPEDPRIITDLAIVYDLDLARDVQLYMTANACVLAEETIGNRYIELIYQTERDEQRTKFVSSTAH